MEKISKSFRLLAVTVNQLKELSAYLKESETEILQRAVEKLYAERDVVFQQDVEKRRKNHSTD